MGSVCTGVVVFHRSMVNWRRVGSVCHGYMCILLYMKLIWCSGFPEIYAWLEGGGVSVPWVLCAFCYTWNLFGVLWMGSVCTGVVVFHRSMVNWRRGWGQCAMVLCAFCYTWNLFGVLWMGSVCTGVVVFHISMVNWRRGMGSVCTGIWAFCYMWKLVSVMFFQRSMVNQGRGWGPSAMGICAFFYIWNIFI